MVTCVLSASRTSRSSLHRIQDGRTNNLGEERGLEVQAAAGVAAVLALDKDGSIAPHPANPAYTLLPAQVVSKRFPN